MRLSLAPLPLPARAEQPLSGPWHEEMREDRPAIRVVHEHDPEVPRRWELFRGDGLRATVLDDGDASTPHEIVDEPNRLVRGGAGV